MKKWIIAIAALAALTGCASRFDTPSVLSALLMTDSSGASIRSLRLEVGETVSLKALTRPENADVSIKWSSSNPSVASVTQDGLVTGLGLGITRILAVSGSYRASCTVTIGGMPAYDIAAAFSAPLTESLVWSKGVGLYASRRIMQGFDITPSGTVFYSQIGSNPSTVNICRAGGPGADATDDVMVLSRAGHGTQIVAEEAEDGKTYIWVNTNGTVDETTGEYNENLSFSRIEFKPGARYDQGYAGETFFLNRGGSYDENGYYHNSQYDQQVSIDFVHRRMLVGSRKSGTRYLWVFDLDEALNLPLEEMQITVKAGTPEYEGMPVTEVTRKIMGRDLGKCHALGQITVPVGKNTATDVYSYSHQGHEIYGNYIYFYEGNAVEDENFPDTFQGVGYMTMFNYIGDVVVPRTRITALSDTEVQKSLGITQSGYVEPESFKVKDGEIFLGFASRDDASSLRKANILRYAVSELSGI